MEKGKAKADVVEQRCHRAVYDKLAQAYGMMSVDAEAREEELTKRWRVSRGPMTGCDRGAVWEGWGVVVDREVSMSRVERQGAMKSEAGASGGTGNEAVGEVDRDVDEARRRQQEMEELMDECDDLND